MSSPQVSTTERLDPRPRLRDDGGEIRLVGSRCAACGYRAASELRNCPACGAEVEVTRFPPGGHVWSATTVHVSVQERDVPYTLAYVDLDDGPRVLVHLPARPPIGSRVTLTGTTVHGDLFATLDNGGHDR